MKKMFTENLLKVFRIGIIILTLILATESIAISSNDSVVNYFWPLRKGKSFFYQGDGIKKAVRIEDIKSEAPQDFTVITTEEVEGFGRNIQARYKYRIIASKDVITRESIPAGKKVKEAIFLKGPVKVGTKWKTIVVTGTFFISEKGEKRNSSRSMTCTCQIEKVEQIEVLKKQRNCVEIICCEGEISTKRFFCEGVGYVGFKAVTSDDWIERLVDISN